MKSSSCSSFILALWMTLVISTPVGHARRSSDFRTHYDAAVKQYEAGNFDGAIKEFQAAYTIKQLPRLLLNIGQAHRKLGHAKDALGFYEFYLRVEPNPKPEIKSELERYIAQTKELLATAEKMRATQDPEEPAQASTKAPSGARDPAPATASTGVEPGPATVPAKPPEPAVATVAVARPELVAQGDAKATERGSNEHRPVYKKAWFWGVVGASTAVVVTAVVVGVVLGTSSQGPNTLPGLRF